MYILFQGMSLDLPSISIESRTDGGTTAAAGLHRSVHLFRISFRGWTTSGRSQAKTAGFILTYRATFPHGWPGKLDLGRKRLIKNGLFSFHFYRHQFYRKPIIPFSNRETIEYELSLSTTISTVAASRLKISIQYPNYPIIHENQQSRFLFHEFERWKLSSESIHLLLDRIEQDRGASWKSTNIITFPSWRKRSLYISKILTNILHYSWQRAVPLPSPPLAPKCQFHPVRSRIEKIDFEIAHFQTSCYFPSPIPSRPNLVVLMHFTFIHRSFTYIFTIPCPTLFPRDVMYQRITRDRQVRKLTFRILRHTSSFK